MAKRIWGRWGFPILYSSQTLHGSTSTTYLRLKSCTTELPCFVSGSIAMTSLFAWHDAMEPNVARIPTCPIHAPYGHILSESIDGTDPSSSSRWSWLCSYPVGKKTPVCLSGNLESRTVFGGTDERTERVDEDCKWRAWKRWKEGLVGHTRMWRDRYESKGHFWCIGVIEKSRRPGHGPNLARAKRARAGEW